MVGAETAIVVIGGDGGGWTCLVVVAVFALFGFFVAFEGEWFDHCCDCVSECVSVGVCKQAEEGCWRISEDFCSDPPALLLWAHSRTVGNHHQLHLFQNPTD